MRKPIQVLIIPYRKLGNGNYEFCLFFREDLKVWQGIAGGVEDDETITQSAIREVVEESGLSSNSRLIKLSSFTTMPSVNITGTKWEEKTYIVYEYSFGVEATKQKISLSNEHLEYKWVIYDDAIKLLTWDSNKTALWELNERLKKGDYEFEQ